MSPFGENASLRARVKPAFVSNGGSCVASNDENGDESEPSTCDSTKTHTSNPITSKTIDFDTNNITTVNQFDDIPNTSDSSDNSEI